MHDQIVIGLTPDECAILHLIVIKHRMLVDWGQLPELKVTTGEMSQIENKLYSGALLLGVDIKSEGEK